MKEQIGKHQIDALVRDIRTNLFRSRPADDQLAEMLATVEHRAAADGRSVLERWAEDLTISTEDRDYARQQLTVLSSF